MGSWIVVENWKNFKEEDVGTLLIIEGFSKEEEAQHYANWMLGHHHSYGELLWASAVEAKRPDPRYLSTTCPHDCDLRVLHTGSHMRFKSGSQEVT